MQWMKIRVIRAIRVQIKKTRIRCLLYNEHESLE